MSSAHRWVVKMGMKLVELTASAMAVPKVLHSVDWTDVWKADQMAATRAALWAERRAQSLVDLTAGPKAALMADRSVALKAVQMAAQ